jgi:histidinol-phosphatase
MSPELTTAREAAEAAAAISREYFQGNFSVRVKADLTPVTEADLECERAIRTIIRRDFPQDGFYGEETGRDGADAKRIWLVDPIDGTKAFVRGYPMFSTQIALLDDGELVLGVSSGTMHDEIAFAERGCGAFINGRAVHVSDIATLDKAAVSAGNLKSLASGDRWRAWGDVVAAVDRIRGYGDFLHYHLLASGKIDAVVESDVNILDVAALAVIVVEAGGVFTDLNGNPPNLATTSVLAANPALHGTLLERLRGAAG